MSPTRLIIASLLHHWRIQAAVACGVAAGAAVLTGALLVGDSMRGSLRDLTLARLGRIEEVLVTQRFFRAELADELAAEPEFDAHFSAAVPAIMLLASLDASDQDPPARAGRVNLVGCDRRFWQLGSGCPAALPESRQIVLNRPLADQLRVEVGQPVILRLPQPSTVPADSAMGRKTETVAGHRMTVSEIIPADGLGRFGLTPTQRSPMNAYVPLDWLQDRLDQPGGANAILVAARDADAAPSDESQGVLQSLLRPKPVDYGISIELTDRGYVNVTGDRMLLETATEEAILEALTGRQVQPAMTYLANTMACGDRRTPYSTITALDFSAEPPLGPLVTADNETIRTPGDGEIVLNSWAADDLEARPGDTIGITFFEPESTDGEVREKTEQFRLVAVAELTGAAADPRLTPDVPGVTDQTSMGDWNPPFPFDAERIRQKDEEYWDRHRATPKAFVSLSTGRRLWQSRFGRTTSLRIVPAEGDGARGIESRLSLDPATLGFVFQPVKRQGLAASGGTTPFEYLFLGLSLFVIAAAVMLVALLFRLAVDGRASQVGILLAVGFRRRKIARLFAGEGLLVAGAGSMLGTVAGLGYAALMLLGLQTVWLGAIVEPFLKLHVEPGSLAIGFACGVVVSFLTIVWSVRRASRTVTARLLAGQCDDQTAQIGRRRPMADRVAVGALIAAVVLSLASSWLSEAARVGTFFGAGGLVLVAALALVSGRLRSGATGPAVTPGRGNLLRLAVRNAARNPVRSTLCVGLIASAAFLIVSLSAFQIDPAEKTPSLASGDGGFALFAESSQPIYHDLNTTAGCRELGFSSDDWDLLSASAKTISLRVKSGEDASCLNLYKPRQPRMLGVPAQFIDRGGFQFAAHSAAGAEEEKNPWLLLQRTVSAKHDEDAKADARSVPVVVDLATATYSLHKKLGDSIEIADGRDRTARLVIVGLLKTSIFQGNLLMNEDDLLELFPQTSGYRVFLVEAPQDRTREVAEVLGSRLADYGFESETTGSRLAGFLSVQNTYLLTFQSLGGLGLLLGTFGLGAVQLRNVLERRGELALLRAIGFRRRRLGWLVMLENGLLLTAGLGCGTAAAVVAILPHLLSGGASIGWIGSLAGTLGLVLVVGLAAGLTAVRATLSAPLVAALRDE